MARFELPDIRIPEDMPREDMPDLLRYWYLGSRARRHMAVRRFYEVDVELGADASGRVLDIGSAWGYNVMALGAWGLEAVGMDLVVDQFPVGREVARANRLEFAVVGGDAAALPFPGGAFRYLTMVETFEHVFESDRARLFAECHRVLAGGGRLVLSTPNYDGLVEAFKRIALRIPWLKNRLPTMCYPADHADREAYHPYRYHQPMPAGAIVALLSDAGFVVRKVKYFLFTTKNTPDPAFPLVSAAERLLERLPGLRRLGATVCVVADKPRQ